jgi:peptidoglycan/LPS O-acetylase OafA/YrhL
LTGVPVESGADDVPVVESLRFFPVDALRGIAALSVLVFHLFRNSPQTEVLAASVPGPLETVLDYSRSGVAIFFVISGFVIGHTTRNLGPRLRDGLAFSLRRQLRLDPPYYVVMLAVVVVGLAERLVPGLVYKEFSLGDFVLNMVYLHDITGADAVLSVAWTLCLEVQFYLVVVLLVLGVGRLTRDDAARGRLVRAAALTLGLVSLAFPLLGLSGGPWFIGTWWMFCIGLALSWFMHGHLSRPAIVTILAVLAGWCAVRPLVTDHQDPWGGQWFAWATAVLIAWLVATDRITARVHPIYLYFGTLSYSLYLVHLPLIETGLGAVFKLTGASPLGAWLGYVLGAVLSVATAHVLQRVVERRSIAWSKKVRVARVERAVVVRRAEAA